MNPPSRLVRRDYTAPVHSVVYISSDQGKVASVPAIQIANHRGASGGVHSGVARILPSHAPLMGSLLRLRDHFLNPLHCFANISQHNSGNHNMY
jgi:hypothetical protein